MPTRSRAWYLYLFKRFFSQQEISSFLHGSFPPDVNPLREWVHFLVCLEIMWIWNAEIAFITLEITDGLSTFPCTLFLSTFTVLFKFIGAPQLIKLLPSKLKLVLKKRPTLGSYQGVAQFMLGRSMTEEKLFNNEKRKQFMLSKIQT